MNEMSIMPSGGITRRRGAMIGSVISARMRLIIQLPRGSIQERSAERQREGEDLQEPDQDAENRFHHVYLALRYLVPRIAQGELPSGAASIEPKRQKRERGRHYSST